MDAGYWMLDTGCWKLIFGCYLLIIGYWILSLLRKVKNKKMPQKHKNTKLHKKLKFRPLHFSEFWCFRDLVAKELFGVGSLLVIES